MSRHRVHTLGRARLIAVLSALMLVFGMIQAIGFPRTALADGYGIPEVTIDANVDESGSLLVEEHRTYDFDDSFNGVYWDIPRGQYSGHDVAVSVDSVGVFNADGTWTKYQLVDSASNGQNGVYEAWETYNGSTPIVRVKLYHPVNNEKVTYWIVYQVQGAASAWSDTGELYWKFVSDGWDVPSRNVTCDIHLPVPEGTKVVPEENVRAWGHGPLDGKVTVTSDGAKYELPGVGTSEFAEARIAFPAEWLTNVTRQDTPRLQQILEEEQGWADEANARRARARTMVYGGTGLGIVLPAAGLFAALGKRRRFKNAYRPVFQDEYFRDMPSEDHPAVLAALYEDGNEKPDHLSASLLRLADMGVIDLEVIEAESGRLIKKMKKHYVVSLKNATMERGASGAYKRSTLSYETNRPLDEVDRATVAFFFRKVAPLTEHFAVENGRVSMWMDEMERVAKKHPETYNDAWEKWKLKVDNEISSRKFFVDDTDANVSGKLAIVLTALGGIVGLGAAVVLFMADAMIQALIVAVVTVLAIGGSVAIQTNLTKMSREGIELKAKVGALRKWLCDFTRLKEAVPHDVILWNKLLVMATALGVADQVIKNLEVAYPELFDGPDYWPMYYWYHGYDGGMTRPYASVAQSVESAHSISTAELASSSDSSGGGGGGGFSGGGGGGRGGGGGGGAF